MQRDYCFTPLCTCCYCCFVVDRKQAASRRAKELLEEHSSLERENSAHLEQIRRLQSLVDALQKYKLDTEPLEADYEQLKVRRATWRRSDVIGRY